MGGEGNGWFLSMDPDQDGNPDTTHDTSKKAPPGFLHYSCPMALPILVKEHRVTYK